MKVTQFCPVISFQCPTPCSVRWIWKLHRENSCYETLHWKWTHFIFFYLFIACRHGSKRSTQMLLPIWAIRLNIFCLLLFIWSVNSWSRSRNAFNGNAFGVLFVGNKRWCSDWLQIFLKNFLIVFLQCF
jgi:hypothetical protein